MAIQPPEPKLVSTTMSIPESEPVLLLDDAILPSEQKLLSLDDAIKSCKDYLVELLDKESSLIQVRVAVVNFNIPSQNLSKYLIEHLAQEIANADPRLKMVYRDAEVKENETKYSGKGISAPLKQELGQLSVSVLIGVSFTSYPGVSYDEIEVEAIHVETAASEGMAIEKVKRGDQTVMALLENRDPQPALENVKQDKFPVALLEKTDPQSAKPTFRIEVNPSADIPDEFMQKLKSGITEILTNCMGNNGYEYVESSPISNYIKVQFAEFRRIKLQRGYLFSTTIKVEASTSIFNNFSEACSGTDNKLESNAFTALISDIGSKLGTKINNSLKK
jgi:hypothetical protein